MTVLQPPTSGQGGNFINLIILLSTAYQVSYDGEIFPVTFIITNPYTNPIYPYQCIEGSLIPVQVACSDPQIYFDMDFAGAFQFLNLSVTLGGTTLLETTNNAPDPLYGVDIGINAVAYVTAYLQVLDLTLVQYCVNDYSEPIQDYGPENFVAVSTQCANMFNDEAAYGGAGGCGSQWGIDCTTCPDDCPCDPVVWTNYQTYSGMVSISPVLDDVDVNGGGIAIFKTGTCDDPDPYPCDC